METQPQSIQWTSMSISYTTTWKDQQGLGNVALWATEEGNVTSVSAEVEAKKRKIMIVCIILS